MAHKLFLDLEVQALGIKTKDKENVMPALRVNGSGIEDRYGSDSSQVVWLH